MSYGSLAGRKVDVRTNPVDLGTLKILGWPQSRGIWTELQRLAKMSVHKDRIKAIQVHTELSSEAMDVVRADVIERVTADRKLRNQQRSRWAAALPEYLTENRFSTLHVAPKISDKHLRNATQRYGGPPHEPVVAIIDTTVFGSRSARPRSVTRSRMCG